MSKKNNLIFAGVCILLCACIAGIFLYDRYQAKEFANNFKKTNTDAEVAVDSPEPVAEEPLPTIYCVGDSITLGNGTDTPYPDYLKQEINTNIQTIAQPIISSNSLCIKLGLNEVYVNHLTIPADATETPIALVDANGANSPTILNDRAVIDQCTIDGVGGSISYNPETKQLVFKRLEAGEAKEITALTKVEITPPAVESNNVLVLFTGSYETSIKGSLTAYQQQIISAFNTDKYIVVSLTKENCNATNTLLATTYGDHYLDFKGYLVAQGLSDAGLTATPADQQKIAAGDVPTSLLSDKINGNGQYNQLLAKKIAEKMKTLGYIK